MKKLISLALLLIAVSCSKKSDVPSKLMLDNKIWMTKNLDIAIPGSYCLNDDTLQCNQYGRLYTWEAAVNGCAQLGEGWRLPTDEEWQNMTKQYGGIYDNSSDQGKSAYIKLTEQGNIEFNALAGGNREPDGSYKRLGAHGFYWTSTEYDSAEAWFYNFGKETEMLNHHTGSKARAVSVRCIRESDK